MNEEKRVRPETRARVLEAAQALNYRPNVMARSLAAGRPFLVGLVYNNPSIHYVTRSKSGR
jgi:transcriptional regulator, LacI family